MLTHSLAIGLNSQAFTLCSAAPYFRLLTHL